MTLKSSNMNIFKIIFCPFYVIASLHANNFVYRSNGLKCGQYKDKEEKTLKKSEKGPKTPKIKISENEKNQFFPISLKNIFPKNQVL